jgi:restriction system protein
MKFKMAKNSLFAILLRSPWWVSVSIGVVLGLIAMALLPSHLGVAGALSGAPFLVIGALAAKAQWNRPNQARIDKTVQAVSAMTWPAFADALEQAFKRDGFAVERQTSKAFDFLLERRGRRMLVTARRWKAARTGLDGLKDLQSARTAADVADALHIGLGELTEQAASYASANNIAIWRGPEVALALRDLKLPD